VLADANAAGRIQAVSALAGADDLSRTALELLVAALGDRDKHLVEAAVSSLEKHSSLRTLETLVRALPVDRAAIREAGRADKAKLGAIKAVLGNAKGTVEIPDLGVDGVLWQRWLKENRGSLRFGR